MNLPVDYQKKIQNLLGEDYENYLNSFAHTGRQAIRVNQLKTEPAEFLRRFHDVHHHNEPSSPSEEKGSLFLTDSLFCPVPWCGTGYIYEGTDRLSLHPYYQAGLYYIQDPSAMAPAAFLPVKPGERVLDLCAAPGGKTTALGAALQGKGVLIANDISASRCRALLKNVQLAGLPNVIITCERPDRLAARLPEYFDKILVDAPCSGEGMFRKDPAMVHSWSPEEVDRYSSLQKEILAAAARMLKPGGCILYSTCTYSPEENEQVVETLLADGTFTLMPLPAYAGVDQGHPEWSLSGRKELTFCRRFWNHRVQGEGQFAALIKKNIFNNIDTRACRYKEEDYKKKNGGRSKRSAQGRQKGSVPEEFAAFINHIHPLSGEDSFLLSLADGSGSDDRLTRIDERIFLLPENAPDLNHIRVISSGLHLGSCRKNRFEPGQALALALKAEEYDQVLRIPSGDARIDRYLRCETIDAEDCPGYDGWCLICVDDYPLGWGKVQKGRIKNKYPAAWRKQ